VALRTTCIKNVKFKIIKQGQVVSMQDTFTIVKTKLGHTKPSTGPQVGQGCPRGSTICNRCRNIEHFICGVEKVKHFVYVHLHCIARNLKRISKISTLPPSWKNFCGRPCNREITAKVTPLPRMQCKRRCVPTVICDTPSAVQCE